MAEPIKEYVNAIKLVIGRLKKDGITYQHYDDLKLICQVGYLNDAENKDFYKKYSDYVKEIALKEVTEDEKNAEKWRNLFWETVKLESFWFFESYLIYMEHKRPYEKRFYEPRQKTLITVVNDLQNLEYSKDQKMYTLSMPSRVGKLLADDTPVLTKRGWITHGELKVGDYVVGRNGEWVKVLQIHPKYYANKRVWFSDHTFIDCHENHEWIAYDRCFALGQEEKTIETKDLGDCKYQETPTHKRNRFSLPLGSIVKGERKDLTVDPYILGVWLGDGTTTNPYLTICNTDTVIVDEVKKHYEHSRTFEQVGCKVYTFLGLRQDLERLNMCHSRKRMPKHIPDEYLNADIKQRLDLLAGLLDTDGTLARKEHRYHFSTTEKQLVDDVYKLISSFGWRVCVTADEPRVSSSGIHGKKTVYKLSFNPTIEIPCRVERKQLKEFSKQRKIHFEKVEDIKPKSGNCISVEGGVYRVGESLKLTHNSTIMVFFGSWIGLRHPDSHNALGTHSGMLADHFYKEMLDLLTSEEYCFQELYAYFQPDKKFIEDKSAEKMTISLASKGDFPWFNFTGIDGTWTGMVDVSSNGYLLVDDLVRDRTHSLSPKRMNDTFSEYLNKMVDRKNDGAKEIMIGTLWNVLDPIKRLEEMYGDDDRYVFRKIPALNENGESNFDYEYKGFSTEYYQEMKDKLIRAGNDAEWQAKFMQNPYVREGLLFPLDELGYFNGVLPQGHKFRFAVNCDVAFGGGDSVSMPIGLHDLTDDLIYVIDWFFNSSGVSVTVPGVCDMIIKHGIKNVTFEANAGGQLYASKVQEELKRRNYLCSCDSVRAPNNLSKADKIKACEGTIRQKFRFLDSTKHNMDEFDEETQIYERSPEYERALDELGTYVTIGKNSHDDACDSIAQIAERVFDTLQRRTVILDCPF